MQLVSINKEMEPIQAKWKSIELRSLSPKRTRATAPPINVQISWVKLLAASESEFRNKYFLGWARATEALKPILFGRIKRYNIPRTKP